MGILHPLTDGMPVVYVNQRPIFGAIGMKAQVARFACIGLRTAFQHDSPVSAAPLNRVVLGELHSAFFIEGLTCRDGGFIL
ncbi:hypothetical protein D7Y23_08885 [Corallococcus sp. AB050B]|nr:hypothetical protein D7Y23_08885 [Corallococcus sp. AB050B]